MKKEIIHTAMAGVLALALAGCQQSAEAPADTTADSADATQEAHVLAAALAIADLTDANGKNVGSVSVNENASGLALTLTVTGLTPGEHGVHIHETGTCTPPDFKSAGGHWNPGGKEHGLENPKGSHEGDMPNLVVKDDGTGKLETTIDGAHIASGDNPLLDADGAAFVIHAGKDDQMTDPSGDSGDRIACGVFEQPSM